MSESIEKPQVLLWFGRLRCPKGSKNLRFFVAPCTLRNSSNAYSSKLGNFLVRGRPSSLGAFWRLWPAMLNIEKVGSPLWDRMQKKIADNYVTAFWDPPKHMGFYMDFFLRIDCGALYTRFLILWSCRGAHVYISKACPSVSNRIHSPIWL